MMTELTAIRPLGRRLDFIEQVAVLVLYSWLVVRLVPDAITVTNWPPLLILLSEGIVVILLLLRKPTANISLNVKDWAIAAGGTFLGMLIGTGGEPIAVALGVYLMVIGVVVHLGAKLSLRRSFGLVAAHRGLKVGGLYRLVRHPMYAGYMLSHIGYLLVAPSLRNVAVYAAVWTLLIARVFAEERILARDVEYRAYAEKVRYRLMLGVF